MLTKKDYIAIGKIIKETSDRVGLINRLTTFMEQDNPNFKKEKFAEFIKS